MSWDKITINVPNIFDNDMKNRELKDFLKHLFNAEIIMLLSKDCNHPIEEVLCNDCTDSASECNCTSCNAICNKCGEQIEKVDGTLASCHDVKRKDVRSLFISSEEKIKQLKELIKNLKER